MKTLLGLTLSAVVGASAGVGAVKLDAGSPRTKQVILTPDTDGSVAQRTCASKVVAQATVERCKTVMLAGKDLDGANALVAKALSTVDWSEK